MSEASKQAAAGGFLSAGLQGAGAGAAIGTFGGPVGTAIGAGVGFIAGGLFGAITSSKSAKEQERLEREAEATRKEQERLSRRAAKEAQGDAAKMRAANTGRPLASSEMALVSSMQGGGQFDAWHAGRFGI